MPKIVSVECPRKCGSTMLIVTRELSENAIEGYCPKCNQEFSGSYVPVRSDESRVAPSHLAR
jgi:hypothetical protein